MSIFGRITGLDNVINDIPAITPAQNLFQDAGLSNSDLLTVGAGAGGLMGLDTGFTTTGSSTDPFSAAAGDELTREFGGGASGGIFDEIGIPGVGMSSDITALLNNIKMLRGGGGGGLSLDSLSQNPNLALRILPGAMALGYAASQPSLDLSNLNNISGELAGNQNAVIRAAIDPVQRNIAAGYGDLLQSQALRGIRGSSFGDTDIANYLSSSGETLGNVAANAAQGSLGLQSDLATNIAQLQNQRQQLKNQLYGTAFDVLGRGLNPQGYAANLGVPTTPAVAPTTPQPSKLQTLANLGSTASNLFSKIGGLFG